MAHRPIHRVVFLLPLLLCGRAAQPDELIMRDGSRLVGTVVRKENGTLEFKTSFAGTIKVQWGEVRELHADQPVKILLDTEEVLRARVIRNTEKTTSVALEPGESPRQLAPSELAFINPAPWRNGEGHQLSGRLNFSLKRERGNTDKDEIDSDGALTWRWQQHRVRLFGELQHDTTNNKSTKKQWDLNGNYNHFFTRKWYYGGVLSMQSDKKADLNFRSSMGPLLGYQFFESKAMNLSTETAMLRVHEEFSGQWDNNYWAAGWSVDFDKQLFGDFLQFYHRHNGRWSLTERSNVIVDAWTGLRFPLMAGFVASTELKIEYDGGAAEDADTTDTTFRVKLGYQW